MKMHDICTNHQGREKPFNQCKGREIPFRVVNVAKITQKLAFSIWVNNLYLSRVAGRQYHAKPTSLVEAFVVQCSCCCPKDISSHSSVCPAYSVPISACDVWHSQMAQSVWTDRRQENVGLFFACPLLALTVAYFWATENHLRCTLHPASDLGSSNTVWQVRHRFNPLARWVTGALGFQNDFISGVMLQSYFSVLHIFLSTQVYPCRVCFRMIHRSLIHSRYYSI